MASEMAVGEVLGRVHLITGPEEFLREREIDQRRTAVLQQHPEAEYRRLTGEEVSAATLEECAAPSLFSSVRVSVISRLEDCNDAAGAALLAVAQDPTSDVALILEHSGGAKGSGLLTKLRKAGSVHEVKTEAVKPSDFPRFVAHEFRRRGAQIAQDAAELLVQAIGQDLRGLSGAAAQLTSDFPQQPMTAALVGQYFGGRAEAKTFVIGDHALAGRLNPALEELRWALATGISAPAITGSLATAVRGLAKFKAASSRGRLGDADLARLAGVPPWKVRTLRDQARGWDEAGLARAISAVAEADAQVKGAGLDPEYALEGLVLQLCSARAGP